MPRGTPLAPAQILEAAKVYEQTGNYSAAARAINADISAVRKALMRAGEPSRAKIHARAIDRGIREGRRALRKGIAKGAALLDEKLEPRDYQAVMGGISHATQRLLDLRSAPLERAKLRADTKANEAKAKGLLPPDVAVLNLSREDADKLFERAFNSAGALPAGDAVDPTATESVPPVVGAVVPVPEAMDR